MFNNAMVSKEKDIVKYLHDCYSMNQFFHNAALNQ